VDAKISSSSTPQKEKKRVLFKGPIMKFIEAIKDPRGEHVDI
jgi:hypothetical protein